MTEDFEKENRAILYMKDGCIHGYAVPLYEPIPMAKALRWATTLIQIARIIESPLYKIQQKVSKRFKVS